MLSIVRRSVGFSLLNAAVMVVLHGNSRQWWPKIPYLSLRDESVAEHARLLFNTLALVTVGQAALGRLPRERWLPRLGMLAALPASLPLTLAFGHGVLGLRGRAAERFHLSLVPILPLLVAASEEALLHARRARPKR